MEGRYWWMLTEEELAHWLRTERRLSVRRDPSAFAEAVHIAMRHARREVGRAAFLLGYTSRGGLLRHLRKPKSRNPLCEGCPRLENAEECRPYLRAAAASPCRYLEEPPPLPKIRIYFLG
ncbi:MAG: hypothetical protein D6795_15920 [Deltaproteobacteria bacterium]|nr:MAG: hypothetical protein D6795_15920 [Deltaproteobacteria bacterium]